METCTHRETEDDVGLADGQRVMDTPVLVQTPVTGPAVVGALAAAATPERLYEISIKV